MSLEHRSRLSPRRFSLSASLPRLLPTFLLPIAVGLAFTSLELAQAQSNPPPWWRVNDGNTVSVGWSFTNSAQPLVPDFEIADPAWYTGSRMTISANVQRLAQLNGFPGVLGLPASGQGFSETDIDNDPRPGWIKIYWMQYSWFQGNQRDVGGTPLLVPGSRLRNVQRRVETLGNGWFRETVEYLIVPQPADEKFRFDFRGLGNGAVAIDDVFVGTHCVENLDDDTGLTLGESTSLLVDVDAATANPGGAVGVAVVPNRATGGITYWISATAPGSVAGLPHKLYALDAGGNLLASFDQPSVFGAPSTVGMRDLAYVETGTRQLLYGAQETPQSGVVLFAFDISTGSFVPGLAVTVQGLPAATVPIALAFYPPGNAGAGTFLAGDAFGTFYEIARNGAILRNIAGVWPSEITGLGYDKKWGLSYGFTRGGTSDPRQINATGFELNTVTGQPTGAVFHGNLNLPLPTSTSSPGGESLGMHAYRTTVGGPFRLACLARTVGNAANPGTTWLYELGGPFRYGHSCRGVTTMLGVPYLGNANFAMRLEGVQGASFASLYLGFSDSMAPAAPLPFPLDSFGFTNCAVLHSLNGDAGAAVVNNGRAMVPVPLPLIPGFQGTPTYWQWVVFDQTAPGGLATSSAGKTLLY